MNAVAETWATPVPLVPFGGIEDVQQEPRVRILKLGQDWKGGDRGLMYLADLQQLERLWIHGAH